MAPSLAELGADMATLGLTGVTDATPDLGAGRTEVLRQAVVEGALPQRVVLLGVDESDVVARMTDGSPWARVGPAKIVIDEVIGLDPVALADVIVMHHSNGRPVAIHAVSRAETVTTTAAFAIAGIRDGDRIEHGSVLPMDLDPLLAFSGLTVIVQPGLVLERGDFYLDAVDSNDSAVLHRAASLLEAGIAVSVGSDAPVTSIDPWATIAAASTRRTRSGHVLGESEKVSPLTALNWYLADPLAPGGPPRNLRVGAVADLCLLDVSLAQALSAPDARHVRMTWVNGRLVHS
jgi:predicted amidohydrolase YtcJ